MAPKGIRKLDPREPLPWQVDAALEAGKPISNIVRYLVVGLTKFKGMVALVYNGRDTTGDRPAGWGMPGGYVDQGETPLQALQRHEGGEIPWPILGDPVHIWTEERDRVTRVERTHFFLVRVDEEHPGSITEEEAQEIDRAEFFDPQEILGMSTVNMDSRAQRIAGAREIYFSHQKFFRKVWEIYKGMEK